MICLFSCGGNDQLNCILCKMADMGLWIADKNCIEFMCQFDLKTQSHSKDNGFSSYSSDRKEGCSHKKFWHYSLFLLCLTNKAGSIALEILIQDAFRRIISDFPSFLSLPIQYYLAGQENKITLLKYSSEWGSEFSPIQ